MCPSCTKKQDLIRQAEVCMEEGENLKAKQSVQMWQIREVCLGIIHPFSILASSCTQGHRVLLTQLTLTRSTYTIFKADQSVTTGNPALREWNCVFEMLARPDKKNWRTKRRKTTTVSTNVDCDGSYIRKPLEIANYFKGAKRNFPHCQILKFIDIVT